MNRESHASPTPSPSPSIWSGLPTRGQLSTLSSTLSPSVSSQASPGELAPPYVFACNGLATAGQLSAGVLPTPVSGAPSRSLSRTQEPATATRPGLQAVHDEAVPAQAAQDPLHGVHVVPAPGSLSKYPTAHTLHRSAPKHDAHDAGHAKHCTPWPRSAL